MSKNAKKTLKLEFETLRELTDTQMRGVQGGFGKGKNPGLPCTGPLSSVPAPIPCTSPLSNGPKGPGPAPTVAAC